MPSTSNRQADLKLWWDKKSTGELQEIWRLNDHDTYIDGAFSIIKDILQERSADIPQQQQPRCPPPKGKRAVFESLTRSPFESAFEIRRASKWPTIIRCTILMPLIGVPLLFVIGELAFFLDVPLIADVPHFGERTPEGYALALIWLLLTLWIMGKVGPAKRNLLEWRRWLSFRAGVLIGPFVLLFVMLSAAPFLDHFSQLILDHFSQLISICFIIVVVCLTPFVPLMGVIVALISDKKNVDTVVEDFEAWKNAGWQNFT